MAHVLGVFVYVYNDSSNVYLVLTSYCSCPTECRLVRTSSSEPWQCIVSLRFLTDENNQPLDKARNIQFGLMITNPKDVEERLRRAQLAILNPSVDPQVFLNNHHHQSANSLNFSSNTVCLEIKGPELTDLSFYDLPGKRNPSIKCSYSFSYKIRSSR